MSIERPKPEAHTGPTAPSPGGDDEDDHRPPGAAGAVSGEQSEENIELDPERPWMAADYEARVERAKDQARDMARITPNYGKAGWSSA